MYQHDPHRPLQGVGRHNLRRTFARRLGTNTVYALFVVAVMVGHEVGLAYSLARH